MSGENYNLAGAQINNTQGNFTLGVGNTTSNDVSVASQFEECSNGLIEQTKRLSLPTEKKQELEETINATREQLKSTKPSKVTIKSLLSNAESIMSTANKSTSLIATFDRWKEYVTPFLS